MKDLLKNEEFEIIFQKVKNEVSAVNAAKVDVVWEPMWVTDMMSESAKLELGML